MATTSRPSAQHRRHDFVQRVDAFARLRLPRRAAAHGSAGRSGSARWVGFAPGRLPGGAEFSSLAATRTAAQATTTGQTRYWRGAGVSWRVSRDPHSWPRASEAPTHSSATFGPRGARAPSTPSTRGCARSREHRSELMSDRTRVSDDGAPWRCHRGEPVTDRRGRPGHPATGQCSDAHSVLTGAWPFPGSRRSRSSSPASCRRHGVKRWARCTSSRPLAGQRTRSEPSTAITTARSSGNARITSDRVNRRMEAESKIVRAEPAASIALLG